jgi:hypothetical protein
MTLNPVGASFSTRVRLSNETVTSDPNNPAVGNCPFHSGEYNR